MQCTPPLASTGQRQKGRRTHHSSSRRLQRAIRALSLLDLIRPTAAYDRGSGCCLSSRTLPAPWCQAVAEGSWRPGVSRWQMQAHSYRLRGDDLLRLMCSTALATATASSRPPGPSCRLHQAYGKSSNLTTCRLVPMVYRCSVARHEVPLRADHDGNHCCTHVCMLPGPTMGFCAVMCQSSW